MKNVFITIGSVLFLLAGISWAGEVDCKALPEGSISRLECERISAPKTPERLPPQMGSTHTDMGPAPVNAAPSVYPDDFADNPFQFKDKRIILDGLTFKRYLGIRSGTFGTDGGREILVSGLPEKFTYSQGARYGFIVRSLGVTEAKNFYGGTITVPHAWYVGQ